ncbi:uncharacterized protein LOC115444518 isoform X2 [Manduca sexta]|nr:uncharacterized protein LOC115444518 isoform X2 [Manduca sexta]
MAAVRVRWRTRRCLGVVCLMMFIHVANGYEETYTISQLSPKSGSIGESTHIVLQTSTVQDLPFSIEPSVKHHDDVTELTTDEHVMPKSAEFIVRESRSINDDIPSSNNEIDSELEVHNKRKYYDIHPTKTVNYYNSDDGVILPSERFGDRLDFKFPGEGQRVPKARALAPTGPRIRPTAVQPIFATATPRDEGRQNSDIQNIITGIVKLLNGNVNVQANSQLLNGRPGRPVASRINNRGPPRITDVPLDFDKITPPPHPFMPTKTPPPYPFDRPPHHGVNLPEQIVPPLNRPGLHRPLPPWQRPRPRPPNRRPNPGLPMYKPVPIHHDPVETSQEANENETTHSENNIHQDEMPLINLPDTNTTEAPEKEEFKTTTETSTTTSTTETTTTSTTTEKPTTTSTTTTTTEKPTTTSTTTTTTTTTEKPTTETTKQTTTTDKPTTTEKLTTSEKPKTEKPTKIDKDKKKDSTAVVEKKHKVNEDKVVNKIAKNETMVEQILQPSIPENRPQFSSSSATPTPTEGLLEHVTSPLDSTTPIEISSINQQPLPTSQGMPYQPYRPRPGIVLDDTDFKPHGSRYRPERPDAAVITAPEVRLPGYGEIFDVTVSAIQGPGEAGSVHIEHINPASVGEHDDIIVSPSGEQGFVSIDGKRTYLNLFDSSTPTTGGPTRVHTPPQHSVPPVAAPSHRPPHSPHSPGPQLGTGVAIPADDEPAPPVRRPAPPQLLRPHQYARPTPAVRIDTCIVGDDSTCDQSQNEKCRTEAGISSCQCRPGYARRVHRDPCRRVVALILNLRVDRLYDRKVTWDAKLADKDSEPYQQLSFEAVRAIDSAFSMTPFSDDFVQGAVNGLHRGDGQHEGVFVNYTILLQETAETLRPAAASDIQKHVVGVLRRRHHNVGTSALWVRAPAASVPPLADVDECSSPELNDCHELASCTNTWGGFKCACPSWTLDTSPGSGPGAAGRWCRACAATHCSDRGVCKYHNGQPYCTCSSGYYGSTCEVDGEVVGAAAGASLAAALVIALTLAALLSWSRKWSREQKAVGMGSPVFNYMAANTIKTPPVGQPPYQVTLEERMRWAQIAEAMVQANHYAPDAQTMATRPSSALFGGYPTLPPVPLPRMGVLGNHSGTLNTVASRGNTTSHHNLYGYGGHMESSSSEASSHVQERADLLVPRPKSRARSMHNQTGIYYDVDYENAPETIYGTKGIPLSTYTVSRGPPFYRS